MTQSLSRRLIERHLFEGAFAPINTTGAAQTGDWFNVGAGNRVLIFLALGAWAGGAAHVTLEQAKDNAATGAKALGFTKAFKKTTFSGASQWAEVDVVADTFDVDTANTLYAIEVDAADLDVDGDFAYVRVKTSSPGANADLIFGWYMSDAKSSGAVTGLLDPKL